MICARSLSRYRDNVAVIRQSCFLWKWIDDGHVVTAAVNMPSSNCRHLAFQICSDSFIWWVGYLRIVYYTLIQGSLCQMLIICLHLTKSILTLELEKKCHFFPAWGMNCFFYFYCNFFSERNANTKYRFLLIMTLQTFIVMHLLLISTGTS